MRRITVVFLTLMLVSAGLMKGLAQVTTSAISGVVKSEKGDLLAGATVTVTYEPTGAVFNVQSRAGGRFDIQNIPPGGPYTVKASYVGFGEFTRSDINIPLGERFDIQIQLTASTTELTSVVVSGRRTSNEKTGASTSFSRRQVLNTPNIGRSLTGVTKITPQSNGNSFAGMNNRYNNLTIDGSLFNNNFGRSGDGMIPGGGVSAISIDAIDQLQVNISPFDVRQAGFIGSGINAVTRRGTNNWYATAYTFFRNQELTGDKVNDQDVANPDRSTKIYGASVGGPIIKNKLFFFANFEHEKREQPGQTWVARKSADDKNPQATAVLASDLDNLKQFLISKYNYNPGVYEGYNFETENTKFLGRIDWNITSRHRLTLRYTQSETDDDDMVNGSSSIGTRINNSRRGTGTGGMAYNGTNFKNNTKVKSGVFELNSNFSTKVSNQLLASYTDNQLQRIPNSNFPFVDIMRDPSNVYISFGTDLFSYKNSISDKALNIADNVTINLGKHTLTAGASYEHLSFANSFSSGGGPSYYRYASLNDFLTEKAPVTFAVAYDPTDRTNIKAAEAKFAQIGLYVQDVWAPSEKFKLTYGLRVDLPKYLEDPRSNAAVAALTFKDKNGNPEQYDLGKWPDEKPLFSPRVGFTYDPEGDKSIIVRGGSGLFTGRIPFIWLVNQAGDNPALRSLYQPTDPSAIRFNTDRTFYIPQPADIPTPGTVIPPSTSITAVADDFKMPQVWRTNLAVDKKLGSSDFVLTFEAIYTKMVNNVFYRNSNLGADTGKFKEDGRPIYVGRLNGVINQALVLDNTSKGGSLALTAQLQKSFSKNWEAGIAYTYTFAQDVAIGSSDQSGSGWTTNQIDWNPNDPQLGYSNYAVPHRIVANGSYRFEYAKKTMATTIGLIYAGASQDRYHFRYGGDLNKDGSSSNDLLFIPADPSKVNFAPTYTPKPGGPTYTDVQQREAFVAFVENNKYLRKHKGQVMEKYGAVLPWFHSLDARVLQDFSLKTGTKRHTLQLSVDIVNVLNLLNSRWGHRYSYTLGSTFQDQGLLGLANTSTAANPVYTFDAGVSKAYQPDYSTFSTWGIQLGIRYLFQ